MITAGYTVHYESVDSYGRRTTRFFKTLAGARKYAHARVGEAPELGSNYAVSGDGIGKITCSGCTLEDLFPVWAQPFAPAFSGYRSYEEMQGDPGCDEDDRDIEAREATPIAPTIAGYQLVDFECPF